MEALLVLALLWLLREVAIASERRRPLPPKPEWHGSPIIFENRPPPPPKVALLVDPRAQMARLPDGRVVPVELAYAQGYRVVVP